jgi:hypothetical protein
VIRAKGGPVTKLSLALTQLPFHSAPICNHIGAVALPNKPLPHSAKHTDRARPSQIPADEVMVRFDPEIVGDLARLEAQVHKSQDFGEYTLEVLQEMAKGKPMNVQTAISNVGRIVRATMSYVDSTKDRHVRDTLNDFVDKLDRFVDLDKPTVTVTIARSQSR